MTTNQLRQVSEDLPGLSHFEKTMRGDVDWYTNPDCAGAAQSHSFSGPSGDYTFPVPETGKGCLRRSKTPKGRSISPMNQGPFGFRRTLVLDRRICLQLAVYKNR